jgi:3-oxoacyl-[acyl-carrier protein] reductase
VQTTYTALVTGASRGIGRAIAHQLSADGYKVLTPSRTEMNLESDQSIHSYLSSLHQRVDVLVNNAGINRIAAIDAINGKDIQDTLQINLIAPLQLIQAVALGMRENKFGRIVNISSIWSMVSRAGRTSYSMSKTAINGMTRSLAVELAPFNVLVNAVAPGYVLTDLTRQNNSKEELEKISETIPVRRLADPPEIAKVVAFLCSENNTYLTGQTIVVDGGYSCL